MEFPLAIALLSPRFLRTRRFFLVVTFRGRVHFQKSLLPQKTLLSLHRQSLNRQNSLVCPPRPICHRILPRADLLSNLRRHLPSRSLRGESTRPVLLQEPFAMPCAEFSRVEFSFTFPKHHPPFRPHHFQVPGPRQIRHHWILRHGALLPSLRRLRRCRYDRPTRLG